MALPVISVVKGGLPVSAALAPFGMPVVVSTSGFGVAVTPVALGGMPVFDTSGTLFGPAVIPANTGLPVITGATVVGNTLLTSSGTWSGSAATYTYQWQRNSAVWTPAALTGLIGWWDMKVPGSITQSAGVVTNLADQSGTGHHLGDGTTTQKPTYSATGFNGFPTMLFSGPTGLGGTNQYIAGTSTFPMGTGNTLTFFAVVTVTSSVNSTGRLISYTASGAGSDVDNAGSWASTSDNSTLRMKFFRNNIATTGIITDGSPQRRIATIDASGNIATYVNGVGGGGSTATAPGNWVSGGVLGLGGTSTANTYWGGAISEAGIATGYSDATTVGQLDTYLKTKWGL